MKTKIVKPQEQTHNRNISATKKKPSPFFLSKSPKNDSHTALENNVRHLQFSLFLTMQTIRKLPPLQALATPRLPTPKAIQLQFL
jgi:hypothetical protein